MRDLAQARRHAILAAAEHLFRHYGPSKTTVADIARAARVGVGTVYLEFPSKDAIFAVLSESRYRALIEDVRAAWDAPAIDHAERLRRALDARVEAFARARAEGAHAAELFHCGCASIVEVHRRYAEAEVALFAELLARGAADGALDAGADPAATARAVLRCYAAFVPPSPPIEGAERRRRALDGVHRVVLYGLVRGGR